MNSIDAIRTSERISLDLRRFFTRYGYQSYKMSRFEEYELYVRNKDFLTSDRMIVFTDINGALMALKPDVTISIIKNTAVEPGSVRRVYYTENVYRADAKANAFKEIMQTGLECIGAIDRFQLCEVVRLAAGSLALTGRDYVLDLSHLGFVSGAFDAAGLPEALYPQALRLISSKNLDGLLGFCDKNRLDPGPLSSLITTCGDIRSTARAARALCQNDSMLRALEDISGIGEALDACGLADKVRLDFSVVNDMRYYSGIVFQGYVKGIPSNVLSGGQYDRLMEKMDRTEGAVGFAVYLDGLEALDRQAERYDADVLLLYGGEDDILALARAQEAFAAEGKSVSAQRVIPEKMRFREVIKLSDRRDCNA